MITELGRDDAIKAMVLQPDSKIVAVGDSFAYPTTGPISVLALARYTPDGKLDPSFGTGGKVIVDLTDAHLFARGILLDPSGKIVVAGTARDANSSLLHIMVARLQADGSFDPTFGEGGRMLIDPGQQTVFTAITRQNDGSYLIAGSTLGPQGDQLDLLVERLTQSGALDLSFGNEGLVILDTSPIAGDETYHTIRAQADETIVLAGEVQIDDTGSQDVSLVKLLKTGSLDRGFNGTGVLITDVDGIPGGTSVDNVMVFDRECRAVVVGRSRPDPDPRNEGKFTLTTLSRYFTGSAPN